MTTSSPAPKTPGNRLADLEFLFTHLERQVADLSRLIRDQQAGLDAIERRLRVLEQARVNEPSDEMGDE